MKTLVTTFCKDDGDLDLNGYPMRNHCVWAVNLSSLWYPATVKGADRPRPLASGVRPYRRFRDATEMSLRLIIIGDCDKDGSPHSDPWAGLAINLMDLRQNVVDPPVSGDGTIPAEITIPGVGTYTRPVIVNGMEDGEPQQGTGPNGTTSVVMQPVLLLSITQGTLVDP